MVAEVDRERVRDRERAAPEVGDRDRHGRRLPGREHGLRSELVRGLEIHRDAGRRVVGRDALVGERELVLFVEVEVHRVLRRVRRRDDRDLERDVLAGLHVERHRHLDRARERVAGRVAHPLVAELHRARTARVPHAAAVVRDRDLDHLHFACGPADRHVVAHPVRAPVGAAEVLVPHRRAVERVPPRAARLEIPAHDVVADRRRLKGHRHHTHAARTDVRSDPSGRALRRHDLALLQDLVGDIGARGDVRLPAVHHGDTDGNGAAGISGLRKGRLEVGHLDVALVHRVLRHRPDRRELPVERVARARRLATGLALDVVAVAVTLHVRRVRGDVVPRPVGRLLLMRELVSAEGLHAELRELCRDDVRDRAHHRRRRRGRAVGAERGDADGALVPAVGVPALGAVATLAAGPHVAEFVDDVAVPDVAPTTRDRVEVIDGADRRSDVRAAVVGDGVMHDGLPHGIRARHPLHQVLVGGPLLT